MNAPDRAVEAALRAQAAAQAAVATESLRPSTTTTSADTPLLVPPPPPARWLGQMDGDPTVYVITGGAKFLVPSPQELFAMGDGWSKVQHVPPHALDRFGAMPAQFTCLREWDKPDVWIITASAAVLIPSPAALFDLGLGWDSVEVVPSGALARNGIPARKLPSASATPSSMVFGPNGDGSAPGTRWPRPETPGISLPNSSHVVELRGWLAEVPEPDPPHPMANTDPDVHYGLVLDVDWLLASGFDLHTLVTAIDVVARDWGSGEAHAVAATLERGVQRAHRGPQTTLAAAA